MWTRTTNGIEFVPISFTKQNLIVYSIKKNEHLINLGDCNSNRSNIELADESKDCVVYKFPSLTIET